MNMFINLFDNNKNEIFDFNILCDLYEHELDKWREYLYDNMQVFMRYSWFNITEWMDDLIWECYIVIDKRLIESIEKWFAWWQIFNFVKFRLKWFLINRENRKDKMTFFESYAEDFVEWILWEEIESLTIDYVKSNVMDMEEPKRTILVMKLLSDKTYTLDKISKIIWLTVNETTKLYKEWLRKLRYILYDIN